MNEPRGVSRRALFGGGLSRLLDEHHARRAAADGAGARPGAAAPAPAPRGEAIPAAAGWGEGEAEGLGGRLEDVHAAILDAAGAAPGVRLLDVTAGDGALALRAALAGAEVTAVQPDPARASRGRAAAGAAGAEVSWSTGLPDDPGTQAGGGFDAVVSAFGVTYAPVPAHASAALVAAVRPGGAIVVAAWAGLMADVLRLAREPGGPRPERWSRYETAYRHFFDFPGLDVRTATTTWIFAGLDEAVAVLAAPAPPDARERVAAGLPALVERHRVGAGADDAGLVRVRSVYALVSARRP
jgi:SAM-dependent methyltransferase